MTVHVCAAHCWHSRPIDVEILRLVAEDYTNSEIGQRLGIPRATIRNRIGTLLAVFGANSRTGLVVAALQEGALHLGDIRRRER
jgi:DNA-binding CsgD family transcriptional regulator